MAGRLIGAWNPALDANGAPISGSLLHTYVAGTTTPKATYTGSDLLTPQANPVVADSAGRFPELWAADAATFDLKWCTAADVQIELFQNIQSLGTAATGAVTRDFGGNGRFNLECRGGVTEIEAGDPSPDNLGGTARIGGWNGSQGDSLTLDFATVSVTGVLSGTAVRGAIDGLIMTAVGSTATFSVSAGQATESTGQVAMTLPTGFTKTTAAWVVGSGNGALDTGAIANSTWYHVFLIQRPDTALVDLLVSLDVSAPTLPGGYTRFRRIGSMLTDGSAHWLAFFQVGESFIWNVAPVNASGVALPTVAALQTVSAPPGLQTQAILNVAILSAAAGNQTLTVCTPGATQPSLANVNAFGSGAVASQQMRLLTNSASQVFVVGNNAGNSYFVVTAGYIDPRGANR